MRLILLPALFLLTSFYFSNSRKVDFIEYIVQDERGFYIGVGATSYFNNDDDTDGLFVIYDERLDRIPILKMPIEYKTGVSLKLVHCASTSMGEYLLVGHIEENETSFGCIIKVNRRGDIIYKEKYDVESKFLNVHYSDDGKILIGAIFLGEVPDTNPIALLEFIAPTEDSDAYYKSLKDFNISDRPNYSCFDEKGNFVFAAHRENKANDIFLATLGASNITIDSISIMPSFSPVSYSYTKSGDWLVFGNSDVSNIDNNSVIALKLDLNNKLITDTLTDQGEGQLIAATQDFYESLALLIEGKEKKVLSKADKLAKMNVEELKQLIVNAPKVKNKIKNRLNDKNETELRNIADPLIFDDSPENIPSARFYLKIIEGDTSEIKPIPQELKKGELIPTIENHVVFLEQFSVATTDKEPFNPQVIIPLYLTEKESNNDDLKLYRDSISMNENYVTSNEKLDPYEIISYSFFIENAGEKISSATQIEVEIKEEYGVSYYDRTIYIEPLLPNQKSVKKSILVQAHEDLPEKDKFLKLKLRNRELGKKLIELKPKVTSTISGIEYTNEKISSITIIDEQPIKVEYRVISDDTLFAEDITIKELEGANLKADIMKLKPVSITNSQRIEHDFTLIYPTVGLPDGKQHITLRIKGEDKVIPFTIERRKPNLAIISIGIDYSGNSDISHLDFTDEDAKDFQTKLLSQKSRFKSINNKLLTTKLATTSDSLNDLFSKFTIGNNEYTNLTDSDVLILFLSSHGEIDGGKWEIPCSNYNAFGEGEIDFKDIKLRLNALKCKKIIFVDACHSGDIKGAKKEEITFETIADDMIIFSSSSSVQSSTEHNDWKNGAWTEAIIEAFENPNIPSNKENKNELTVFELEEYLEKRVPELAQSKGTFQNPLVKFKNDSDKQFVIYQYQ